MGKASRETHVYLLVVVKCIGGATIMISCWVGEMMIRDDETREWLWVDWGGGGGGGGCPCGPKKRVMSPVPRP